MPKYNVTIQATVTKTLPVIAGNAAQATEFAHERFTVACNGPTEDEDYDEQTLSVELADPGPNIEKTSNLAQLHGSVRVAAMPCYAVFIRGSGGWLKQSVNFDDYAAAQTHAKLVRRCIPFVQKTRVRRVPRNSAGTGGRDVPQP